MADNPNKADVTFAPGIKPSSDPVGGTDIIAISLSLIWLILAGGFFVFLPSGDTVSFDSLRFAMVVVALFLPVAMIWVAAASAKSARIMRDESRRLQASVDAMRMTFLADRRGAATSAALPVTGPVERKLNDIGQTARAAESGLGTFTSTREPSGRVKAKPVSPRMIDDQPTLALGTAPDENSPPLSRQDMIRALNFPDTDKDEVGFGALRRALKDRQARQLIQASQDVLTLLSQDGIYMDDLHPDRAKPEVWRRFAAGERGRAVAALGGIRDRSCLALAIGRMREDTIFRDAAHHFLRLFDRMLISFEPEATDEDISDLSETRTARAFMLLGRVTGAFD